MTITLMTNSRMKYRYLDLRRPSMTKTTLNYVTRSNENNCHYLDNHFDFCDIEKLLI